MASIFRFKGRRLIMRDSNQRLFLLNVDYPQTKIEFQHRNRSVLAVLSRS